MKSKNKNTSTNYPKQVVYYGDFCEDFDGGDFSERKIDGSYKYIRKNPFYKIYSFLLYRGIFTPIGLFHSKFIAKDRFIGKRKLSPYKRCGKFIYANHTQPVADAFSPHAVTIPEPAYTIISSKNFKLPVLGRLLPALGGLPLPTELSAARNFSGAVKQRISQGRTIVIFPEGHLWPYCPFLRPFRDGSFDYPIRLDCPSFCMTRVYTKRRGGKIGSDIYIDGPFFPDKELSAREARAKLAEEIRETMEARLVLADVEVIRYEKIEEKTEVSAGV